MKIVIVFMVAFATFVIVNRLLRAMGSRVVQQERRDPLSPFVLPHPLRSPPKKDVE